MRDVFRILVWVLAAPPRRVQIAVAAMQRLSALRTPSAPVRIHPRTYRNNLKALAVTVEQLLQLVAQRERRLKLIARFTIRA